MIWRFCEEVIKMSVVSKEIDNLNYHKSQRCVRSNEKWFELHQSDAEHWTIAAFDRITRKVQLSFSLLTTELLLRWLSLDARTIVFLLATNRHGCGIRFELARVQQTVRRLCDGNLIFCCCTVRRHTIMFAKLK